MKTADLAQLQQACGYHFEDERLLERALVHASAQSEDNEHLEFLGDSVLGYAVTKALLDKHGMAEQVGLLAERKAALVSNQRLTSIAQELGIDRRLVFGRSVTNDPHGSSKVCADALEAVIGAICMDGGIQAAQEFVNRHVCTPEILENPHPQKHPKTLLQEWASAHNLAPPAYRVLNHKQIASDEPTETWVVRCSIHGLTALGNATAKSKREAERLAAQDLMDSLSQP
ncbi:MAG: ribonuclease III [Gammaproteobacteria bacterium]|nr:ribonuclease III [Gammaproteobacteria bacterium]